MMPGAIDTSGLSLRSDYFGDPLAWRAFCDLLIDIFGIDVTPLEMLGGPDPTCMPTGFFDDDGCCIANLSAFSMPLMIDGEIVRAAGWQSGAVRPAWRGRGLFRQLMDITFERCSAAGYEAMVLTTRHPGLYEPYGFKTLQQAHFSVPMPSHPVSVPVAPTKDPLARRLDIRDATDLALIRRVLAERTPVSNHFAVLDQSHMLLLNAWLSPSVSLHWLEHTNCITATEASTPDRLSLLDIIASNIPPLTHLHAALAPAATEVDVHFPPDRLSIHGGFETTPAEDGLALMMWHRDGTCPTGPLRLSPMADF